MLGVWAVVEEGEPVTLGDADAEIEADGDREKNADALADGADVAVGAADVDGSRIARSLLFALSAT